MKIFFFTLLLISNLSIQASKLTSDQLKEIEKDGFSTQTEKLKGYSWPRVIIKARVKTTPLSSVAIFAAFDHQKNYIPNLLKSDIHKVIAPNQIQVSYELKMAWPLSNSTYINDHVLESLHPENYKLSWSSVQNSSAKSVKGSATFLPFPGRKGETLMIYENHVVPDTMFAGVIRGLMIKDTESSITATINEIENLSVQKSTLMLKYESKILDALNNKAPY